MTNTEHELLRERWRRARAALTLVDPRAPDFATGGLARWAPETSVRLVLLPADPETTCVEFTDDVWAWWLAERSDPFGKPLRRWWSQEQPTSTAAVRYDWTARDQWGRYCALGRHGGLELGLTGDGARQVTMASFPEPVERRVFFLVPIVGLIWVALDLYRDVVSHLSVAGPWEVSLSLRATGDALLSGLATGWEPFGMQIDESKPCHEPALLARRELDSWPDADGAHQLALSFGAWIEDSWGSRARRFIARGGPHAGAFDQGRFA